MDVYCQDFLAFEVRICSFWWLVLGTMCFCFWLCQTSGNIKESSSSRWQYRACSQHYHTDAIVCSERHRSCWTVQGVAPTGEYIVTFCVLSMVVNLFCFSPAWRVSQESRGDNQKMHSSGIGTGSPFEEAARRGRGKCRGAKRLA